MIHRYPNWICILNLCSTNIQVVYAELNPHSINNPSWICKIKSMIHQYPTWIYVGSNIYILLIIQVGYARSNLHSTNIQIGHIVSNLCSVFSFRKSDAFDFAIPCSFNHIDADDAVTWLHPASIQLPSTVQGDAQSKQIIIWMNYPSSTAPEERIAPLVDSAWRVRR